MDLNLRALVHHQFSTKILNNGYGLILFINSLLPAASSPFTTTNSAWTWTTNSLTPCLHHNHGALFFHSLSPSLSLLYSIFEQKQSFFAFTLSTSWCWDQYQQQQRTKKKKRTNISKWTRIQRNTKTNIFQHYATHFVEQHFNQIEIVKKNK